jgi:hypothetical protein
MHSAHRLAAVAAATLLIAACSSAPDAESPQGDEGLWAALQPHCGKAYEGRLLESNATDTVFARSRVVMHVRQCDADTIRIPLHVGEDRSRTWILTRTDSGFRLKHDHRHADGSEDSVTQYGGDTRQSRASTTQEFHADQHTAAIVPAAATNIWTMAMLGDSVFVYALRREGRRFRVEFDLRNPVAPPPAPWGY